MACPIASASRCFSDRFVMLEPWHKEVEEVDIFEGGPPICRLKTSASRVDRASAEGEGRRGTPLIPLDCPASTADHRPCLVVVGRRMNVLSPTRAGFGPAHRTRTSEGSSSASRACVTARMI